VCSALMCLPHHLILSHYNNKACPQVSSFLSGEVHSNDAVLIVLLIQIIISRPI